MTEAILILSLFLGGAIAFYGAQYLNLLREQRLREDRQRRIRLVIETGSQLKGLIERMTTSLPDTELASTLQEATLVELKEVHGSILQAKAEVAQLESLFIPRINTLAAEIGLNIVVQGGKSQNNNQQNQQRQN